MAHLKRLSDGISAQALDSDLDRVGPNEPYTHQVTEMKLGKVFKTRPQRTVKWRLIRTAQSRWD